MEHVSQNLVPSFNNSIIETHSCSNSVHFRDVVLEGPYNEVSRARILSCTYALDCEVVGPDFPDEERDVARDSLCACDLARRD